MAPKVTTAAERSKRTAKKPVTSDKGRNNRSSVSKAEVTKDGDRTRRGTNPKLTKGDKKPTGRAPVTRSASERPALPPKGGTSGNSLKAVTQRGGTRHNQAVRSLDTQLRGTANLVRTMNARDKQDTAAKGTKGTEVRTGQAAKGELAKRSPSAITPANKGGTVARPNAGRNGGTTDGRIQQVRVRDITKPQLTGSKSSPQVSGSNPKALKPAGTVPTTPPKVGGGAKAVTDAALKGAKGANWIGAAGSALAIPGQVNDVIKGFDKLANHPFLTKQRDQKRGGTPSTNRGPRRTGQNSSNVQFPQGTPSGPGSRRGAAPVSGGGGRGTTRTTTTESKKNDFSNARAESLARTEKIKEDTDKDIAKQRKAQQETQRRSQQTSTGSSSQSSASGSTQRKASPSSSSSSSSSTPSTSTSTSGTGREWKDFNPGRGTSESNNPLLNRQGGYLRKKMQEREERQSQNVGPVKDGAEYTESKKSAEITTRRKTKEEEDKKKKARTGFSQKDSFE